MNTVTEYIESNPINNYTGKNQLDDRFDNIQTLLNDEYPNVPFHIIFTDEILLTLDTPLGLLKNILVEDIRFYNSDFPIFKQLIEENQHLNILNNKPITLSLILKEMELSDYYHNEYIKQDDRNILVNFYWKSINHIVPIFKSYQAIYESD